MTIGSFIPFGRWFIQDQLQNPMASFKFTFNKSNNEGRFRVLFKAILLQVIYHYNLYLHSDYNCLIQPNQNQKHF